MTASSRADERRASERRRSTPPATALVLLAVSVAALAASGPRGVLAQSSWQTRSERIDGGVEALDVRETSTEIRISLKADVLFDFDKSDLRPEAWATLAQAANVIKRYADSRVSVEGHTDGKGAEIYNQELSEKRATAVKDWLVSHGAVDGQRLETKGWGKTKPVAPNAKPDGSDDPDGRRRNRRVEIVVNKR